MRKSYLAGLLLLTTHFSFSQDINAIINKTEVERIEKTLASDDMQGRRAGTPGIEKAASFIANEFRSIGLQPLNGLKDYRQEFGMFRANFKGAAMTLDGKEVDQSYVVVLTTQPEINMNEKSSYEKVYIRGNQNFFNEARKYASSGKNLFVMVDTAHMKNFSRLTGLKRAMFKSNASQVFVLSAGDPSTYSISAKHEVTETKFANVAGIIPGKSKKDEYVIFSAHYDHLGIGKPNAEGDSIYNGANDDAAGTTAMIMLAKYYKALNNNERTLVFVAFTAEEMGGYGSQYFSKQMQPEKVMAMFNIEMIGTESKWGKNSAYITGFEKTDMGAILQRNLEGSGFTFHPDPYPQQQLFYRSDNATLARLGVPAHTISTAKMEDEKHYHKPDDEIETLDMDNMAAIIRSIAISAKGIVAGKETPSRVKVEDLR